MVMDYIQSQIESVAHVFEDSQPKALHIVARPAIIPFRGINVESSTKFKVNIPTMLHKDVDTACEIIQDVLPKLRYENVDTRDIMKLLDKSNRMKNHVTDRDIIYVLNHLHEEHELELNYKQLMDDWAEKFEEQLNKVKRVNPNANTLRVEGSAFYLLKEIVKQFGGLGPATCTKEKAVDALRKGDGAHINSRDFCSAVKEVVDIIIRNRKMYVHKATRKLMRNRTSFK